MIMADKILTEVQINRFLKKLKQEKEKSLPLLGQGPHTRPNETRIVLDYFLFSILIHTGLRISEALKLSFDDIHDDFLIVKAENSKNKKRGTVYFGDKTHKLFMELIHLRKTILKRTDSTLLFSLTGKTPSRSYAHTRFKMWLKIADINMNYSIHSLRHTYGTLCLDKGLSLTFVRDQLRHSNISITSQYLHLTKANRDKVKDLF